MRQECAHLDQALLRPERRFYPFGGMTLKVIPTEKMLLVAVINIHSLLVRLDNGESEQGGPRRRHGPRVLLLLVRPLAL
jgi:hypothetical protein